MTPERYERLCELFDQAQAAPPDRRAALLDEVGAADPALRAELEAMLSGDRQARGEKFLRGPSPITPARSPSRCQWAAAGGRGAPSWARWAPRAGPTQAPPEVRSGPRPPA
jgi:hypothetical protein